MRTLIAYGTRYGATAGTSREIAKILTEQGFEVKVADLKEEKIKDVNSCELIIVGTGVQFGRWISEVEEFLKEHEKELAKKKLALFVSTMKTVNEREGNQKNLETDRKFDLDNKLPKYSFHPISVGFFGGVINFNKMNFFLRKTMGSLKERLEKDGFKESEPGVYELRNWDEIRNWTIELAEIARKPD